MVEGDNEEVTKSRKNVKKKLIGIWTNDQIESRILEIEQILENKKEKLSKSRRRLLYSKVVRLRKGLKGGCAIGGQKEAQRPNKTKKRIDKTKRQSFQSEVTRWKECLCCRGKGHTMAECRRNPDFKAKNKSCKMTICFNCGKDDHTLWDCDKPRSEDGYLHYAKCFLCGESGHLSSKCQQNTTGIYPNGGGCHACSSIYHLLKDCPSRKQSKIINENMKPRVQYDHSSKVEEFDEDNDSYWT